MYNHQLDTFLTVAECGSFTKAADALYLSPTAVMKQMNALEQHLGLRLLVRTHGGIRLTASGEVILQQARKIRALSREAITEARAAAHEDERIFRIGTSLLNPAKPFMDLWYRFSPDFPDYRIHLLSFEDDHEGILSEVGMLGEKYDFLIGVCDSRTWLSLCRFQELGRYRKMIAVPRSHPLAKKKKIRLEDLHGRTLMMVPEGDSGTNDFIRHDLRINHPEIRIEDTPQFYDLSVFNRCAETGNVLLTIECWKDVHPALVTIPVEWNYTIPYGLLYAKDAPADVLRFVDAVQDVLSSGRPAPSTL